MKIQGNIHRNFVDRCDNILTFNNVRYKVRKNPTKSKSYLYYKANISVDIFQLKLGGSNLTPHI